MRKKNVAIYSYVFYRRWMNVLLPVVLIALIVLESRAVVPGLPFTEDFSSDALKNSEKTNANWSTDEQQLILAWRRAKYGAFSSSKTTGSDITIDENSTCSVALGDVDGDGDLDLIEGNSGQANRLYLSNGTENPFVGVTGLDISSDTDITYSVTLGDMDGDGDLDLIAGNSGQVNRLYLNNGTTNPFYGVTGSDITTDVHVTRSVILGDVDRDGDLDLIAGNFVNQINRLYLNNGTTNPFAGVTGSNITLDTHDTLSVALGDVDGDGDLDLIAGNYNSQVNRLYLNNGTAAPFNGVTGLDITSDSLDTVSIALGDLDGDGDLDLVAGNYNSQQNRLYLNNGSPNPFFGDTGSDITSDVFYTRSIVLGDVDSDGDLDLIAGNYGSQANRLYLNNGTVTPFNNATGFEITSNSNNTHSVALGDMDGDGDLDLIAGNLDQVNRLYFNNASDDPFTDVTGSDITSDIQKTTSCVVGDVDGDGDLDLIEGNYNQSNLLYLNNGTTTPFNGVTGLDISSDTESTYSVVLGDVDRDGDLDLIVGNNGQTNRLYLNNGTAEPFNGVTGLNITNDSSSTYSVTVGDVDGDGDLDVISGNYNQTNRLYLNNGTVSPFSGVYGLDITSDSHETLSVSLVDIDRDGDLDLIAGNYGQTNRLYLNDGTMAPFNGINGTDITSDSHYTHSVVIGDVDRDGDMDLIVGNANQPNRLYLNNGTAVPFNSVIGSDITLDAHYTLSVVLVDVDGDGYLDLIAGNLSNQVNRLYLNNGTTAPFKSITGSDITSDAHQTQAIAVEDMDRDGDLDVVVGNFNQTNRLYLNNKSKTSSSIKYNGPQKLDRRLRWKTEEPKVGLEVFRNEKDA